MNFHGKKMINPEREFNCRKKSKTKINDIEHFKSSKFALEKIDKKILFG